MRALRAADASSFAVTRAARRQRATGPRRPGGGATRARARPCVPPSSSASLRPTRSRQHLDSKSVAHDCRVLRRAIDRAGHAPEGEVERGVGDGEARQDLGSEEPRVQAPEPADRAKPVTGPGRRAQPLLPVGLTPSWFAANAYDSSPATNVDRVVRDVARTAGRASRRPGSREPTHVDTADARSGGELCASRRTRARRNTPTSGEEPRDERERARAGNGCARDDERAERSKASRRAPDAGILAGVQQVQGGLGGRAVAGVPLVVGEDGRDAVRGYRRD